MDIGGLKESWTSVGDKSELAKDFEGFQEPVQKIIELMDDKPSKWKINDRDPLSQWVYAKGKVVLMGDAAHAMLPHQGAGAGQAIEDGYILACAMRDFLQARSGDPTQTFENWADLYQATRLPRAQKVQTGSRESGDIYECQTPDLINKDYEDCIPLIREKLDGRMNHIWTEDVVDAYERAKTSSGL